MPRGTVWTIWVGPSLKRPGGYESTWLVCRQTALVPVAGSLRAWGVLRQLDGMAIWGATSDNATIV